MATWFGLPGHGASAATGRSRVVLRRTAAALPSTPAP